jgi:tetratricopeptide (TPR) repeat protein
MTKKKEVEPPHIARTRPPGHLLYAAAVPFRGVDDERRTVHAAFRKPPNFSGGDFTRKFCNPAMAHALLCRCWKDIVAADPPMKLRAIVLMVCAFAFCAFAFATPVFADARHDAKSQVEFGINVAQRGLWREAIYRWEKAVELDPTYAEAYNNLAIAYEHEGQLDKARKAYEKALELAPNNSQIRQNYELFKEINDRTSSKQQ